MRKGNQERCGSQEDGIKTIEKERPTIVVCGRHLEKPIQNEAQPFQPRKNLGRTPAVSVYS